MATAKQRSARRPSKKTTAKSKKTSAAVIKTAPQASNKSREAGRIAAAKKSDELVAVVPRKRLPTAFAISKKVLATIWSHKKLFIGIAAIYMVLNVTLV